MPHKTLIIGVGGTGLSTIREIRRLIAERYELGLEAPEVSSIRFLYIDTDEGDVNKRNWFVLGKKIHLRSSECAYITGDKLGPLVETPDNHPAIAAWMPPVKDFIGDPGPGAKGIRPYGRLIYEAAENKAKVRKACTDLYNGLDTDFSHFAEWRIYLIAGLSGGTGSGMSLPLSFDLVRWHLHARGVRTQKFFSFFVLPPLQISDRHARYHQNAYAFLRELNYRALQSARAATLYQLLPPGAAQCEWARNWFRPSASTDRSPCVPQHSRWRGLRYCGFLDGQRSAYRADWTVVIQKGSTPRAFLRSDSRA